MIVIWSRLGFVALLVPAVIIIPIIAFLVPNDVSDAKQGNKAVHIGFVVGCFISAVALWFLGRWLNAPRRLKEINPETGRPVEVPSGNPDTLFFIPVQYWAFAWVVIGLVAGLSLFG